MRYFLFNYGFNNFDNPSKGSAGVLIESEIFPSEFEIRKKAIKANGIMGTVCIVSITGWKEFNNREDYDNFRKTLNKN